MRRFVILRHEPTPSSDQKLHWDLMVQDGKNLTTWALAAEPAVGLAIDAQQLTDHRSEYLDFEGPISGGRGTVIRMEAGRCQWLQLTANDRLAVLHGDRLRCRVRLQRTATDHQRWVVSFFESVSGPER